MIEIDRSQRSARRIRITRLGSEVVRRDGGIDPNQDDRFVYSGWEWTVIFQRTKRLLMI